MKHSLLLLACIPAACALMAQDKPEAQWCNLMGGTLGDQSTAIAIDANGNPLWLGTAASTEASPAIFYAGQEIFSGAPYNAGNSGNNNLALICTAPDGSEKWTIYSTSGDYASNQGNIAVDSDGNIIFTAKVRQTDGMLDVPMNVVDASGNKIEYSAPVEKRAYGLLIAKASADGSILWTKFIQPSTAPAPAAAGNNADFTPDAVSSTALAVDASGSIYIGGNYCSEISFGDVTLQPTNVSTWTGDSQTSCGNMFLVKLDSDGEYEASAIGIGDINGYSSVQSLNWSDNSLYICGLAKGNGTFSFAGKDIAPTEINCPIIGCLDENLSSNWIKCLPSQPVAGKNAVQNLGISVCADNLWLCGQFNQKICDPSDESLCAEATQGALREGFVIRLNKNDGAWLGSAVSRTDYPDVAKLTGYFKVLQSADHLDKAYVYGYAMDANIGVFLREYNADDLTPVESGNWNIATGGGVPTAVAVAYDPSNSAFYITARGNKAFTLMADPAITTVATKGWDVLMAKYSLPTGLTSGISSLATDRDANCDDLIYDLCGRYVGSAATQDQLPAGIYIKNHIKFVVR